MPLYEYKCDACGERFEKIQKYSEMTETCTRCGQGPVHRLHSSPAIQFKGSGFYITDYAQKGKSGDESRESPSSGGEGKSDTTEKSEKSEKKSEKGETKKADGASGEASTKTESTPTPTPAPKTTTKDAKE